jgi:hypothetical protein
MKPISKEEVGKDHRKKLKEMDDYFPSKEEGYKRAKCIALGYKCYAVPQDSGKGSPIKLEVQYINLEPKKSQRDAFPQKYLTYHVTQYYNHLFEALKLKL